MTPLSAMPALLKSRYYDLYALRHGSNGNFIEGELDLSVPEKLKQIKAILSFVKFHLKQSRF